MNKTLSHLIAMVASGCASAMLVMAIGAPSARPAEPVDRGVPAARPGSIRHDADDARVARLERRLGALEADVSVTAPRDDLAGVALDDDPELATLSLDEQRIHALGRWQGKLDAHAGAPTDASWAPRVEAGFQDDLTSLGDDAGFRVATTNCRTTTCIATVDFEGYDAAVAGHAALLHHDYAANCAREVVLPEPAERSGRYTATVLYDCANLR